MRRLGPAVALAGLAFLGAGCAGAHHTIHGNGPAGPAGIVSIPGGSLASGNCGSVHWNAHTHRATLRRFNCGDYHPIDQGKLAAAAAYAYELPIDPEHPDGQWSTLVRTHPVGVGYRLRGIFRREWIVVGVKPLPQDGENAAVRGWRGKWDPVWYGRLVLRLADRPQ